MFKQHEKSNGFCKVLETEGFSPRFPKPYKIHSTSSAVKHLLRIVSDLCRTSQFGINTLSAKILKLKFTDRGIMHMSSMWQIVVIFSPNTSVQQSDTEKNR